MSRGDREPLQGRARKTGPRSAFKLDGVIKGSAGNFDHLQASIEHLARVHNSLVDDVDDLGTIIGGTADHTNRRISELETAIEATGGGVTDHGALSGLADDDHPQYMTDAEHTAVGDSSPHHAAAHTQTSHDAAETGDIVAVAATADAGTSTETPNADHRHAHGSGYAGGHSDYPAAGVTDHGALTGLTDDDHTQYIKDSEFDAAGDLLVGSGSDTFARLAKGTDGQLLSVDAAEATDLKWIDPPEGGGGTFGGLTLVWNSKVSIKNGNISRRIYIPFACTIVDIYFSVPVESHGGTCIMDVKKNGSSVFTSGGDKPTIPSGDYVSDHVTATADDTLAQDDYLTCHIDDRGGTAGRWLAYIICYPN